MSEKETPPNETWVFAKWHNKVPLLIFGVIGPVTTVMLIAGVWYYFSPRYTDVGYMPEQPVPYSHKLHAGELGIDCRYCHTGVEVASSARVPPTQTCMNCHSKIKTKSLNLHLVRESWAEDKPIEWVKIHKTPDYAYFPHSAHIQAGVGCESCHGRIDQMVEVYLSEPLNMGWCLDCHREPERHVRPKSQVTKMGYFEEQHAQYLSENKDLKDFTLEDMRLKIANDNIEAWEADPSSEPNPPQHCSGCHR